MGSQTTLSRAIWYLDRTVSFVNTYICCCVRNRWSTKTFWIEYIFMCYPTSHESPNYMYKKTSFWVTHSFAPINQSNRNVSSLVFAVWFRTTSDYQMSCTSKSCPSSGLTLMTPRFALARVLLRRSECNWRTKQNHTNTHENTSWSSNKHTHMYIRRVLPSECWAGGRMLLRDGGKCDYSLRKMSNQLNAMRDIAFPELFGWSTFTKSTTQSHQPQL